jgi:hypothetical protein
MSDLLDRSEPEAPAPPGPTVAPSPWWRALSFVSAVAFIGFTLSRIELRAFARHVAAMNARLLLVFSFARALLTAVVVAPTIWAVTFPPVEVTLGLVLRWAMPALDARAPAMNEARSVPLRVRLHSLFNGI